MNSEKEYLQNSRPQVRIGHINIKVSDLERSLVFYRDQLGFKVIKRIGNAAAFLAYSDYHHDLCINTWDSLGGLPPQKGNTGLFHLAILFPDKEELNLVYNRLKTAGITIDAFVDHGVNESVYLRDPDENGIELYCDRHESLWWDENRELKMHYIPSDADKLFNV